MSGDESIILINLTVDIISQHTICVSSYHAVELIKKSHCSTKTYTIFICQSYFKKVGNILQYDVKIKIKIYSCSCNTSNLMNSIIIIIIYVRCGLVTKFYAQLSMVGISQMKPCMDRRISNILSYE